MQETKRPDIPPRAHRCRTCDGLGRVAFGHGSPETRHGGEKTWCPDCDGRGWTVSEDNDGQG